MTSTTQPRSRKGEPVWELAELFPLQGEWSEERYLGLHTNRLVEFDDGTLEFLPMPTWSHQRVVLLLYRLLFAFLEAADAGGEIAVAPFRLRVANRKYREPDLVFVSREHMSWTGEAYWTGADLVVEVVSPGNENRDRDFVSKRADYAACGVAEYWIIDPDQQRVHVLTLRDGGYADAQIAAPGDDVASLVVPGFTVPAVKLLPAAD